MPYQSGVAKLDQRMHTYTHTMTVSPHGEQKSVFTEKAQYVSAGEKRLNI